MKKVILAYFFFCFAFVGASAQTQKLIPPGIKKAIVLGNSKMLAVHFSQSVELLIKEKEDVYSKAQAELILKDFFNKNAPEKLIIEQEGESNGICYAIGLLKTKGGQFRIYMAYQKTKGKSKINRLDISDSN